MTLFEEVQIPLNDLLEERAMGWTVKSAVIRLALRKVNATKDWSKYNMTNPNIIARDSKIVVQFFPIQTAKCEA